MHQTSFVNCTLHFFADELDINVGRCCSDLLVMSLLCEQNRLLFGSAWKKYSKKGGLFKWAISKKTKDSENGESESTL